MKKTKIMIAVLLVMSMSLALISCGSKNNDSEKDKEKDNEVKPWAYDFPAVGFGFDLPESVKLTNGFIGIRDVGDVDYDSGVMAGWPTYYDIPEEEYETRTEGSREYHVGNIFDVVCVKDANSEEEAKEKMMAAIKNMLGGITEEDKNGVLAYKMIHQENGYLWMAKISDRSDDIREECTDEYNALCDASEEIINNLHFYTPRTWKGNEEGTVISFDTVDLNGNPVNSKTLFAQNKVTMINIWATTCGPCINEMPELEEMNREFSEKGGAVVGLVDDVWVSNMKYLDEAKEIVEDTGVTYTNLCAWDGFDEALPSVGTPTTYFVDSQGRIIGDAILGALPHKYKEKMEEYLARAK